MQVSAHPIAAGPAALQPVPQPAGCSPAQDEDSPFAKLLSAQPQPQRQPQDAAKPAGKPAAKPAAKPTETAAGKAVDADDKSQVPQPGDDTAAEGAQPGIRQARPAKLVLSRSAGAREAARGVDTAPHSIEETTDTDPTTLAAQKDEAKAADTPAPAMDPALAQWLASLNRPVEAVTPPESGGAPGGAPGRVDPSAVAIDTQAVKGLPRPLPTDANDAGSLAAELPSPGLELPQTADGNTADTALIAALDERHNNQQPTEHSAGIDNGHAIGALAATSAASPGHRAEPAAAPLPVSLPTPVTSPGFQGALGMQVSVLARDGIQHAELHLNPAEMGPISVQIALDGSQARVDFGADSAITRQIIEAGLPELASALRDAGLTLSGGGVSQHSRGQAQGDGAQHQRGTSQRTGGSDEAGSQAARRVNLRLPLGAVDLYA